MTTDRVDPDAPVERLAAAADMVAIQQVLARYPHAVDDRDWDALAGVFTDDAVCEMSDVGLPTTRGRKALVALFDRIDHPVAHHLVDPVVDLDGPDHATVRSKWLVTLVDRTTFGGTYTDEFLRTAGGWRICHRRITPGDASSRRPVRRYDLAEEA